MSNNIWLWNLSQGSVKVIESDTIWYVRYGFLLVFHSNFVPFFIYSTCKYTMILKAVSKLLKVIENDTYRSTAYNFLLKFHGPILYRFRDKRRFQSKIAKFLHPRVFCAPAEGGSPWNLGVRGQKKLEWWSYRAEKDVWRYLQPSGYNTPTWRMDRQTPSDSKDRA